MKFSKKTAALSLLGCAMLAAPCAWADEPGSNPEWANSAWYVGAGVGRSQANIDQERLTSSLMANGATSVAFSSYERDTGYKLYLGKQLNRNFAVEGGYFDLGKFGFNATTTPPGTLNGEVGFRGWNLDMLGALPVSARFSVYGRVGMHSSRAEAHFTGDRLYAVTNRNPNQRNLNGKVGVGLEYKFTDALALRGELERYRVNDAVGNRGDVDLVTLNLVYKLGQPAAKTVAAFVPPPVMPQAAPEPVAPAPAPAPVVAAPAPQPTSERFTFSAETLFDFDKSTVKPAGKLVLDELVRKLKGTNTEVMIAVGYTDSVGKATYNQHLSERRAEAVKAYLVSDSLDGARIYTEGKGEALPVGDNASAQGRAANRRVTIEVVGTRNLK